MWALGVVISAIRAEIWTAVLKDALGNRWNGFEVGDMSESTFLRL